MARPIKNNAEWFTHDADMRNDVKVKALRRKFSNTGYAVWCYLLESLTDTDFFEIEFSEIDIELLAADYDVKPEELTAIVEYCCRVNLLQKTEDGKRLYSEAHKRRFSGLITKRERDRERIAAAIAKRQEAKNGGNTPKTPEKQSYRSDNPHNTIQDNTIEKNTIQDSRVENNIIYPYRDIVALWNETCISLPKVKTLNDTRRQKIKCRLNEIAPNGTAQEWLDNLGDLFRRVQASDFLTGSTGWQATFDWFFENGKNWVKVSEGNYDNGRGRTQAQRQQTTPQGVTLGVGEYIDPTTGRRTYGTGKATIPPTAPARPSEKHQWDSKTQAWILL